MGLPKEIELLREIAEYRVLTPGQASLLGYGGERNARRSLNHLAKQSLVTRMSLDLRGNRGRPGIAFGLCENGVDLLREEGVLATKVPYEDLIWEQSKFLNHQILLTWIGIQFKKLDESSKINHAKFLASTSPFSPPEAKIFRVMVRESDGASPVEDSVQLLPDAVVALNRERSSLLFFVELDCGTEALRTKTGLYNSIEGKVHLYQHLLGDKEYKKLERVLNASLRGFRLLFIAETENRRRQIERLVGEITPKGLEWSTDFIWTTSWEEISEEGIDSAIWTRGSNSNGPTESILGEHLSSSPVKVLH